MNSQTAWIEAVAACKSFSRTNWGWQVFRIFSMVSFTFLTLFFCKLIVLFFMEIIAHSFAWLLKAITSVWHDRWIGPWSSFKWSNPFLFLRFYELILPRKWLYFSPGKIIHEQIISDQQMNYRIYGCSEIEIWNFEHLFLCLAKCNMVFQPTSHNPSKWSSLCAYALNHCSALTFSITELTNYNHFGGFWKTL